MSATPDSLASLITPLQSSWNRLYGGQIRLVTQPRNGALSIPLDLKGADPTWLEADPPADDGASARTLLESWAGLLDAYFTEHQLVDGLVGDLVIAWNRLAFLNSISALMRTTVDPTERAVMSIRLAAQALEVENAFVGFSLPEGITVVWAKPSPWEDEHAMMIEALDQIGRPLWCNDPESVGQTLPGMEGIHTFAGHKLRHGDTPPLYVGLVNHLNGPFNAGDLQIFDSLIEMLTSFMQSAALHERELEIETLNRDLGIAAEIQASFLPSHLPRLEGHEIAASVIPASMLGGDLCDVVECGPGQVAVVVCDVAGKGVGAALLAAELRAILRGEVRKLAPPDRVLQNVNTALLDDMERNERFATVLLLMLGPDGRPARYASAGHTTGLLIHGETLEVEPLTSSTLPLGILDQLDEGCKTIDFVPGDVLLVYSDGLTETQNERGELLGLDRVLGVLLGMHHAPTEMIVDSLIGATSRHRGSATLQDDLTLVVVRRLPDGYVPPVYVDYFTVPGRRSMLSEVETRLARLKEYLLPGGDTDKWLLQVQLAVTEAVSNIVIHAYGDEAGEITGLIALYPDRLEVDLVDSGEVFDPPEITRQEIDVDHLDEGGRGLSIIHDVMDNVVYRRVAGRHNYWKLGRHVPAAARANELD